MQPLVATICFRISNDQRARIDDLWAQSQREAKRPLAQPQHMPKTRSDMIRVILEEGLDVLAPLIILNPVETNSCHDLIMKPLPTSVVPDLGSCVHQLRMP